MVKLSIRIWILIVALLIALLMISPSFEKGVVITHVEKNSTEFDNGLRAGMKIKQINSETIKTIGDYRAQIEKAFAQANLTRLSILTDKEEFIFLSDNPNAITVKEIPRSKIKTGLDLSGGARALVKPENISISDAQIEELVAITSNRLNAFGLTDLTLRSVKDLSGNNYMLIEIAGASSSELKELIGKQGKFEAKIANQTVFVGGQDRDIRDICRNDATCAGIMGCSQIQEGYACNFQFAVYLSEEAAKRHADITRNLSLDETGQYLSDKLYLYVDDIEMDSLLISSGLRGQTTTQISIQGSGTGSTRDDALNDAKASMKKLQTILLTGSLPYKLEIVKLDSISPFLGEEFTRSLILLGLVVFAIVSLIVFIRYRKIKITLAVILTMFSEMLITLGIAAFINWNLDAPSIAGIIAGIGTGINDQIIILDESEKHKLGSIKDKIKRALFVIVGAFFTIVAAMIPLFWAGAGMLRGFALTTIIGVSVGILITRPAFADMIRRMQE